MHKPQAATAVNNLGETPLAGLINQSFLGKIEEKSNERAATSTTDSVRSRPLTEWGRYVKFPAFLHSYSILIYPVFGIIYCELSLEVTVDISSGSPPYALALLRQTQSLEQGMKVHRAPRHCPLFTLSTVTTCHRE